jgi:hypothetical protein
MQAISTRISASGPWEQRNTTTGEAGRSSGLRGAWYGFSNLDQDQFPQAIHDPYVHDIVRTFPAHGNPISRLNYGFVFDFGESCVEHGGEAGFLVWGSERCTVLASAI